MMVCVAFFPTGGQQPRQQQQPISHWWVIIATSEWAPQWPPRQPSVLASQTKWSGRAHHSGEWCFQHHGWWQFVIQYLCKKLMMVFLVKKSSLQNTVRIVRFYLFIVFNGNTLSLALGKLQREVTLPIHWTYLQFVCKELYILCCRHTFKKIRKFYCIENFIYLLCQENLQNFDFHPVMQYF